MDHDTKELLRNRALKAFDSIKDAIKAEINGDDELAEFYMKQCDAAVASGFCLLDQALARDRDKELNDGSE